MVKPLCGSVVFCLVFFLPLFPSVHAQETHQQLTTVLQKYVKDGLVDYKYLCQDQGFKDYTRWLSMQNPSHMGPQDSMAYWINAYNAFTLQLICDHYPVRSINDIHTGGLLLGSALKKTAWDKPFISIQGQAYTLNQIEHKILRQQYKDPRIHFAIVCAAKSCPPLRWEAYEGFRLDQQLDDQARIFLVKRTDLNSFDEKNRTAKMSMIFKWFRGDFGNSTKQLLIYLSRYLPAATADSIKTAPERWQIKFNPYDWSLNER